MLNSTKLKLPYLSASQSQKHVTVNEGLRRLDAIVQLSVKSATTSVQPGAPADGDCYILPAGKTGANWASMTNGAIAYYVDGAWIEVTPREGWIAWIADTDELAFYAGAAWSGELTVDRLKVLRKAASTGYVEGARIRITNNASGTNYSQFLFGQIFTNGLFIEAINQANVKGAMYLQPYGGEVILGSSGAVVVTAGVKIGTPTGGDKGYGSINAQAVYDDNVLLSCYVFDQALDGAVDAAKWDAKVPDRVIPGALDQLTGRTAPSRTEARSHDPMRKFLKRIGGAHDPLTLDGYARHWKEKRHLASMPNEAAFDPEKGMAAGEWIQRLIETVEIQAVLIEQLNQRMKTAERAAQAPIARP